MGGTCSKYRIYNKAHTKLGSQRGEKRVFGRQSTDKCKVTPSTSRRQKGKLGSGSTHSEALQ
jgi:hypothetical protein